MGEAEGFSVTGWDRDRDWDKSLHILVSSSEELIESMTPLRITSTMSGMIAGASVVS